MTRSMLVMLALAAGMFAVAPWIIDAAPYEATMGLVYKIYLLPHAVGVDVPDRRRSSPASPASGSCSCKRPRADALGARPRRSSAVLFGAFTLVTGPLWARKAWGVWWVWDARLTSSLMLFMIFVAYLLLRKYGGPGSDKLGAGMALFGMANVPFIYVSVNVLAHAPSADVGRADAAGRDGHSAVVLRYGVHAAVHRRCCACAPASNTSARASKRSILPRTKRDATSASPARAGRCCVAGRLPSRRWRMQAQPQPPTEFVPVDERAAGRADSGHQAAGRGLRLRLGRRARLRVVARRRLQKVEAELAELESRRK